MSARSCGGAGGRSIPIRINNATSSKYIHRVHTNLKPAAAAACLSVSACRWRIYLTPGVKRPTMEPFNEYEVAVIYLVGHVGQSHSGSAQSGLQDSTSTSTPEMQDSASTSTWEVAIGRVRAPIAHMC